MLFGGTMIRAPFGVPVDDQHQSLRCEDMGKGRVQLRAIRDFMQDIRKQHPVDVSCLHLKQFIGGPHERFDRGQVEPCKLRPKMIEHGRLAVDCPYLAISA